MSDRSLTKYIERVTALRERRAGALEPGELRQIALEVGLTEADLAAAEQAARDHLTRGRNLLEHGSLELAVGELNEAAALAPGALEPMALLARAHLKRWQETGAEDGREAARALAKQCMRLDPEHREAYEVLAAVEQRPARRQRAKDRPGGHRRARIFAAGAGLALVVSGAVFEVVKHEPAVEATSVVEVEAASTPVVTPRGDSELPVELAADPRTEELVLETRMSTLKNYPDKSFYELHAALRNESTYEYSELELRLVYLDASGAQVGAPKRLSALGRHQAIVRPGDVHVFRHLEQVTPQVAQVRLEVATSQRAPTSGSYLQARPIALDWRKHTPRAVTVGEREQSFSSYTEGLKTSFFKATWEVTNETGVPLRKLGLVVELYDARGNKLLDNTAYVTHAGGVVLRPGETRLVRTTIGVEPEFDHYKLAVSDVE